MVGAVSVLVGKKPHNLYSTAFILVLFCAAPYNLYSRKVEVADTVSTGSGMLWQYQHQESKRVQ